ncbi:MAG: hypothetical protein ABL963_05370 [Longimicrobiales bacterium]
MGQRAPHWIFLVALALALAARQAEAQQGIRSGLWIEGAIGTGTIRHGCGGCDDVTSTYGGTDYLRAGVSLAPRVLLGLELFSLSASDVALGPGSSPVDAENRSIAPIVIWYVGRSGFFLRGGAGLAHGTFTVPAVPATVTTRRTGSALIFGVGFDVPVAGWAALTASLGTNVMAIGDVSVNGTVVDDIIATVYEASVGIALR